MSILAEILSGVLFFTLILVKPDSDKLSFDFKSYNDEEAAENYDLAEDADFQAWAEEEFDGNYWEGAKTMNKK